MHRIPKNFQIPFHNPRNKKNHRQNKLPKLKKYKTSILLDIISRIGYFTYFAFDNIYVISALRKFPKKDQLKYFYISKGGWLFSNLISIIKNFYDIYLLKTSEKKNNNDNDNDSDNNNNIIDQSDSDQSFKSETDNEYVDKKSEDIYSHQKEILGRFCDTIISAHFCEIPEMYFDYSISDGVLSIAGIISSCII